MPLFNFQKQFAPAVESGEKRQTIRARRKNRPQVGQTAFLYTGTRTKACRKLGEHIIQGVHEIVIGSRGIIFSPNDATEYTESDAGMLDYFAKEDGFENWKAMRDWFKETHGLPFEGDLIQW